MTVRVIYFALLNPRQVLLALLLLIFICCGVSGQAIGPDERYVDACHYYGPECNDAVRLNNGEQDTNITESLGNGSLPGSQTNPQDLNVTCGLTAGEDIEFCSIPLKHRAGEPNLDRHQCFALYRFHTFNDTRTLLRAGCAFNHGLDLCSAHQCNFSHAIALRNSADSLHYCCCHTSNHCNRDGIVGHPYTGPTTMAGQPRTGQPTTTTVTVRAKSSSLTTKQVTGIAIGSIAGVVLLSIIVFAVVRAVRSGSKSSSSASTDGSNFVGSTGKEAIVMNDGFSSG